jgi:hypothetical protein
MIKSGEGMDKNKIEKSLAIESMLTIERKDIPGYLSEASLKLYPVWPIISFVMMFFLLLSWMVIKQYDVFFLSWYLSDIYGAFVVAFYLFSLFFSVAGGIWRIWKRGFSVGGFFVIVFNLLWVSFAAMINYTATHL